MIIKLISIIIIKEKGIIFNIHLGKSLGGDKILNHHALSYNDNINLDYIFYNIKQEIHFVKNT